MNLTEQITALLKQQDYIATDEIATVVYLADKLGKPVLAEGPAGEDDAFVAIRVRFLIPSGNRSL
jgi:hypothetical protein